MQNFTFTLIKAVERHIPNARRFGGTVNTAVLIVGLLGLITVNNLAIASNVQQAHIHGVAELTVAFENGVVEMQFESPAISLLGFEHAPKDDDQVEIVNKTKAVLSSVENVPVSYTHLTLPTICSV